MKNKKFWVLFALFVLPLVFYIMLLTGTINFAKLPVLTENVSDVKNFTSEKDSVVSLENRITILSFLGNDLETTENNALNLNEKIYKKFHKFTDFQFVVVLPKGTEEQAKKLKEEIAFATNMSKFNFVFGTPNEITSLFNSLKTNFSLNDDSYSPHAFIIDREMHLRGRNNDEDTEGELLYGYNAETVAPIHNKMVDDVKVLIAEYRFELKKNKREI